MVLYTCLCDHLKLISGGLRCCSAPYWPAATSPLTNLPSCCEACPLSPPPPLPITPGPRRPRLQQTHFNSRKPAALRPPPLYTKLPARRAPPPNKHHLILGSPPPSGPPPDRKNKRLNPTQPAQTCMLSSYLQKKFKLTPNLDKLPPTSV